MGEDLLEQARDGELQTRNPCFGAYGFANISVRLKVPGSGHVLALGPKKDSSLALSAFLEV